jgi:hypothetical protein
LVKAITLLVRNIVEAVKFTCTMKVCFAHVAVCMQLRPTPSNKEDKERRTRKKNSKDKIRNLRISEGLCTTDTSWDLLNLYYDRKIKDGQAKQ